MDRSGGSSAGLGARMAVFALSLASVLLLPGVAHAAFPGANGKIAFYGYRDEPNPGTCTPCNSEIYVMGSDGSTPTRLTNNPGRDATPVWSPDGNRIAFVRGSVEGDIYVMNANGTGQTMVASDAESPAWSPDGSKLVYEKVSPNGSFDLFTVNAGGGGETQITNTGGGISELGAVWSPDGSKLAYGRFDDNSGAYTIYTVNPDGTGDSILVSTPGLNYLPDWSPDGSKIVFERGADIVTINSDGSGETNITNDVANDHGPAWSPDGKKIVFESSCRVDCQLEIYSMNADGSGVTKLTAAPLNYRADWQPVGAMKAFPRPGGGTPLVTYFVPAYDRCTAPNTAHVGPLASGSCTPPVQTSSLLTTSKIGVGKGFVRLDTVVGNPLTGADEADLKIQSEISDVRNASDQSDYSGQVLLASVLRISDRASGFGGVSGTASDLRFDVPIACTPSAVAPSGSDCQLLTTADSLVPGMISEGKRSVISTHSFQVLDAGTDGDVSGAACPPTCGTGDEEPYLEQGTFTP